MSDACVGPQCMNALSASSSLSQGEQFVKLARVHGGKRRTTQRRGTQRRATQRRGTQRRGTQRRGTQRRGTMSRMRGGSASYPDSFSELLPQDLHGMANISSQDNAFAQLPSFVGKYGGMTGGRRTRKMKMKGGVASVTDSSMILAPSEEPAAFLNPQWYNENQVVPSFKGPENAYANQQEMQYKTQFDYTQKAGRRQRKRAMKRRSTRR